jgi:hypothetical protein
MEDVYERAQSQFEERIALHQRLCGLFRIGMDEPQSALGCIFGLRAQSATCNDPAVLGRDIGQMLVNMALAEVQALWIVSEKNSKQHGSGLRQVGIGDRVSIRLSQIDGTSVRITLREGSLHWRFDPEFSNLCSHTASVWEA